MKYALQTRNMLTPNTPPLRAKGENVPVEKSKYSGDLNSDNSVIYGRSEVFRCILHK